MICPMLVVDGRVELIGDSSELCVPVSGAPNIWTDGWDSSSA